MRAQPAPLTITMALLMLAGCGRADQPSPSDSVTAPIAKTAPSAAPSQPRVETAVVEFSLDPRATGPGCFVV